MEKKGVKIARDGVVLPKVSLRQERRSIAGCVHGNTIRKIVERRCSMGDLRSTSPKRGVQIPGSYSDTEILGMAMWDKEDEIVPARKLTPHNQSVLVVDDDAEQLRFLKRIIERAGFKVITSQSATEALDVLGERPVDIVVSDYKMPEMDGFEFLQALRGIDVDGNGTDIPVIMLTACGDDLEFVALERGADMFCEKFRAESLLVKQINFLLEM